MCKNYLQHVLSTLWKRKSGALAFVMAATVLVLLVQYHSVQHEASPHTMHAKNMPVRTLNTLESRANQSDRDDGSKSLFGGGNGARPGVDQQQQQQPEQSEQRPGGNYDNVYGNRAEVLPTPRAKTVAELAAAVHRAPVYPNQDFGNGQPRLLPHVGNVIDNRWKSDPRYNPAHKQQPPPPQPVIRLDNSFLKPGNVFQAHLRPQGPAVDGGNMFPPNQLYGGAPAEPYIPKHRLFHLDLKGAPAKVAYLKKLFPVLKGFGATGVLLEYEDMFPYEGDLAATAAKNHYSKDEVKAILQLAKEQGFDVIPLVQTFGHAEFILKLRQFGHLREVSNAPQAFCPSNNDTMSLLEDMIDQVMELHPGVRWLHIGLDEVYQLGVCPRCMMHSMTQGRDALFLEHVARVASYVRQRHNVIPIMWDDMLHHFTVDSLKQYDLGNLVEIMIWTYVQDVYRFIPHDIWAMYGEVFPYVWAASAFKGAFGETLVVPPLKRHLENNVAWLEVMAKEQSRFKEFRGIAITGWQRYDHFATLCELLPASVPSLAVNLLTVTNGYFNESWMQTLYDGLQCMKSPKYNTFIDLDQDEYLWDKMSWCFFPGVTFFKLTQRLESVRKSVATYLLDETVKKAWLTEYNVRHNYSNLARIDASLSNFPLHYPDVEMLIRQTRDALREVYDEYVVAEWIEQNEYPMLRKLDLFRETAESLKKASVWPARPLDPLPELQKYGIGIPIDNPSSD